jgi:hypothetical protein
MNRQTIFYAKLLSLQDRQAMAEESNKNPNLTWIRFVFTDDQPNGNSQAVSQIEYPNIISTISHIPIKANYTPGIGLGGHDDTDIVGFVHKGQQESNKILGTGAIWNSEYPELIEYFKKELAEGRGINFSWELQYSNSEKINGIEYLKGVIPTAMTAVKYPAYEGRTQLQDLVLSKSEAKNIVLEALRENRNAQRR